MGCCLREAEKRQDVDQVPFEKGSERMIELKKLGKRAAGCAQHPKFGDVERLVSVRGDVRMILWRCDRCAPVDEVDEDRSR